MSYPANIRRCQHIKVNGTQCGSPALREEQCCYFHMRWRRKSMDINMNFHVRGTITLPTLEDANSIQVGLAEVMRLLVTNQIDHRTAALLLHALRTASFNVKLTSLEPELPTTVVIDQECVERRPLGATAWSTVAGREYDDVPEKDKDKDQDKNKDRDEDDENKEEMNDDGRLPDSFLWFLIDRRLALDPGFLDKWVGTNRGEPGKELVRELGPFESEGER